MTLTLSTYTGSLTQFSLSKTVSRQAQLVAWRHLGRCSLPDGLVRGYAGGPRRAGPAVPRRGAATWIGCCRGGCGRRDHWGSGWTARSWTG